MPKITLTSPILGRDVDDGLDVTREMAKWATTNGYAVYTNSPAQQARMADPGVVTYTADEDPTLAANREGPDEGKTPGVDDKTVSDTQSDGTTSGASQDRSGTATGTQDGPRPLANVDASPEDVDAFMESSEPAGDQSAPGDGPFEKDGSPVEDAGTADPDAEGKATPKKNAKAGKDS